jgi:hypothetical protein
VDAFMPESSKRFRKNYLTVPSVLQCKEIIDAELPDRKEFAFYPDVCGWAFVALCIVAGFVAMNETNVIFAFIGAGLLSVVGFLIIGIAQMGLAQIATAENTGQMLEIMRKKAQLAFQDSPASVKAETINDVFFQRSFFEMMVSG